MGKWRGAEHGGRGGSLEWVFCGPDGERRGRHRGSGTRESGLLTLLTKLLIEPGGLCIRLYVHLASQPQTILTVEEVSRRRIPRRRQDTHEAPLSGVT